MTKIINKVQKEIQNNMRLRITNKHIYFDRKINAKKIYMHKYNTQRQSMGKVIIVLHIRCRSQPKKIRKKLAKHCSNTENNNKLNGKNKNFVLVILVYTIKNGMKVFFTAIVENQTSTKLEIKSKKNKKCTIIYANSI